MNGSIFSKGALERIKIFFGIDMLNSCAYNNCMRKCLRVDVLVSLIYERKICGWGGKVYAETYFFLFGKI